MKRFKCKWAVKLLLDVGLNIRGWWSFREQLLQDFQSPSCAAVWTQLEMSGDLKSDTEDFEHHCYFPAVEQLLFIKSNTSVLVHQRVHGSDFSRTSQDNWICNIPVLLVGFPYCSFDVFISDFSYCRLSFCPVKCVCCQCRNCCLCPSVFWPLPDVASLQCWIKLVSVLCPLRADQYICSVLLVFSGSSFMGLFLLKIKSSSSCLPASGSTHRQNLSCVPEKPPSVWKNLNLIVDTSHFKVRPDAALVTR